jgi:hypothetical protein
VAALLLLHLMGNTHGGLPLLPLPPHEDLPSGGATSLLPRLDLVAARAGSHLPPSGGSMARGDAGGGGATRSKRARRWAPKQAHRWDLGFFCFFNSLTVAGICKVPASQNRLTVADRATASVKARLTVTFVPRRLRKLPRLTQNACHG